MFYIYLQVLFRGQPHDSCCTFREPHSKNFRVVMDHGLDARLVVHVLDEFLAALSAIASALASYPSSHLKKSCI